ncbi:MAG: NAD(P)/FAD-dependent oxidoreductase [Alphaproteobacteria bacterium]|nr:MAG: NAD(P)/FAD-dependent oxidoreductase [Alphaproteobacteria bacterium]
MEQIMPGKSSVSRREFDIVIIGAGVIGCAMARRFTLEGAKVILIERAADILAGASKGNSAILHTGFDAEPQSLELKCMQDGYEEYQSIRQRLGLPLLETGAMVVAWSEDELARLEPIFETAKANGVGDVELLQPGRIYAREPQLARGALGAVLVPREHIIDPWSAPLAYLGQAVDHGAEIRRNTELKAAQFRNGAWQLETTSGPLAAHWLINCAGLFGDKVEELALGQSSFTIKPRKGQFIILDKAAAASMRTTLLPVPNERTKGIVLCRTIFGNVLVGPTAEETDERDIAAATTRRSRGETRAGLLRNAGHRRLCGLAPGQRVEAVPHPLPPRASLYRGGRDPLDRSHRGTRHCPPCLRSLQGGRQRRDRLPLRERHAPRDRAGAAGRARGEGHWRPQAAHPRHDGPLPGLLLLGRRRCHCR